MQIRHSAFLSLLVVSTMVARARAQELVHVLHSEAASDYFGAAIDRVGDVNGDGVDDVIVGAPSANGPFLHAGAAYLFSGLNGASLYTWRGLTIDDQLGTAVAGVADCDGDGVDDVLVGMPNVAGSAVPGKAQLYSGATGASIATLEGEASGSAFGASCARLGDLTRDGVSEFAIGALGTSAFYVYDGRTRALLFRVVSSQRSSGLGFSIAGTSDLTGDGIPDLLVSAPFWHDSAGVIVGRVEIRSGTDGSIARIHEGENRSSFQNDNFGWSIAVLGDADSDGVADYAIGAWAHGSGQEGRLYVYSGATGAELHRLDGEQSGDWMGYALARGGDLDHDGRGDLLVGLPNHGTSYQGRLSARSGADLAEITRVDGSPNGHLGVQVAPAADVDHDGTLDLYVATGGGPPSFRSEVLRLAFEPPQIGVLGPERGAHQSNTVVTILGTGFRPEAGLVVTVDGVVASNLVALDSTTLQYTVPSGTPGLAAIDVSTRLGDTHATFKRTPAITLAGDPTPGGTVTWSSYVDAGDTLLLIYGLSPMVAVATPPFDGLLGILPYATVDLAIAPTDQYDLEIEIDDDPALVGATVVIQDLAGPKLFGKHKAGAWTNCIEVTIE